MAFSYSFHMSAKAHAVTSVGKVLQVSRHNLRDYKSNDYDRTQIEILKGSEKSILSDIESIYHYEFDEALEHYNAKQTRSDRVIDNYLEHVSKSRSDVAVEIIIQVGDMDFWKDKSINQKKRMTYIFKDQIRGLEELCPDFKIASAVIHYDEKSPHMHVVGVPVAHGYVKGMKVQCAKTKIFTKESLAMLQDKMRKRAEKGIELNRDIFGSIQLKEKEKGRNKDIPKAVLNQYYELQNNIQQKQMVFEQIKNKVDKMVDEYIAVNTQKAQIEAKIHKDEEIVVEIEKIKNKALCEFLEVYEKNDKQKEFLRYTQLKEPKTELGKRTVALWEDFSAWWEKKYPNYQTNVKKSLINKLDKNKQIIAKREAAVEPKHNAKNREEHSL